MPTEELRRELRQNMLPKKWLGRHAEELIAIAAETELSGGSITNVVRRCAIQMVMSGRNTLDQQTLKERCRRKSRRCEA